MPVTRTWTIGSASDGDLILSRPSVSGLHCRLSREGEGFFLEDLGSSNGTFVNGRQIGSKTRVTRDDLITLGNQVALPWPEDDWPSGTRVLFIGRGSASDCVIEDGRVSERHARLIVSGQGGPIWIEDLGSTNGLAINAVENTVQRSRLLESDSVYFGSLAVPASRLLGRPGAIVQDKLQVLEFRGTSMVVGRDPGSDRVIDSLVVSGSHARLSRSGSDLFLEDLGSSNGTFVNGQPVFKERRIVREGDEIGLGRLRFRLTIPQAPPLSSAELSAEASLSIAVEPEDDESPPRGPRTSIGASLANSLDPDRPIEFEPSRQNGFAAQWLNWFLVPGLAVILAVALLARFAGSARASITQESWNQSAASISGLLFWLGISAIACGGMASLSLGQRLGPGSKSNPRRFEVSWLTLVADSGAGLLACGILLAIVHVGTGLQGPWPAMLALLAAAMLAGLALGMLATRWTPDLLSALGFLTIGLALLVFLGGHWPARPGLISPIRLVTDVLPSRWVFEGLVVLESDSRPTWQDHSATGETSGVVRDMADRIFPAGTDRMGPLACELALLITVVWGVSGSLLARKPGDPLFLRL